MNKRKWEQQNWHKQSPNPIAEECITGRICKWRQEDIDAIATPHGYLTQGLRLIPLPLFSNVIGKRSEIEDSFIKLHLDAVRILLK